MDLSLDRVLRLLDALDNPQLSLPPTVHVAGTNGKGSVVAFMAAALAASGLRVHSYTSPHLVHFHERIRLNGARIGERNLTDLLIECESANQGQPITFFEITTAAAFLAFRRTAADILLLETGLGGRLDATNTVPRPRLSALTPIDHDHQAYLGDSLTAIAAEKAAILRPGVPCVVGPQSQEVLAVIERTAAEVGTDLLRFDREWRLESRVDGLSYRGARWSFDLPPPALSGRFQAVNAGTAVACLEALDIGALEPSGVGRAIADTRWPGRLQQLADGPLRQLLPPDWQLWVDSGHNAAASAALAEAMADWRDQPVYLVFGMLADKDPAAFLRPLAPLVDGIAVVTIPDEMRTLPAASCLLAASEVGLAAATAATLEDALRAHVSRPGPARVLICGSLSLAGKALAANGTPPD